METLLYYPGFQNTTEHLAGTSRMVLSIAKIITRYGGVVIASDLVKYEEVVGGVKILKTDGIKNKTILPFDVVFFMCGKYAIELDKPDYQKWIRYQHCWNFNDDEYTYKYDMIIGVSKKHADYMICCGYPEKKVVFIGNFINTEKFYKREVKRNDCSIMYCGSISENKGIHLMIDAIKSSHVLSHRLHIDVYGDCKMTNSPEGYYDKLKKMSEGLDITFHGSVGKDELAIAYSRNSAICLPSTIESFGLVLAEAQACGCIPIAHNSGGVSESVNEKYGHLYSPNTVYELGNVIKKVFTGVVKEKDREECIRYALNKFGTSNPRKQVTKIIDRLFK